MTPHYTFLITCRYWEKEGAPVIEPVLININDDRDNEEEEEEDEEEVVHPLPEMGMSI